MIAYVILGVCLLIIVFILLMYLLKHPRRISGSDFGVAPWQVRYRTFNNASCLSFKQRSIFCCHNSSGKIYLYYLNTNNNVADKNFLDICKIASLKPEPVLEADDVNTIVFNNENTGFYKDVRTLAADTIPDIHYAFSNGFLFQNVVNTIKDAFENYEGLCYDWDGNLISSLYMSSMNNIQDNGSCWPADDKATNTPPTLGYKAVTKPPPIRWEDWGRMMLTYISNKYLTIGYDFCSDALLSRFVNVYVCSNQLYNITVRDEPKTMLFTWSDINTNDVLQHILGDLTISSESSITPIRPKKQKQLPVDGIPDTPDGYQHECRFTNNHELHDLFKWNAVNNIPCLISYTQTKTSQPKQYQHLFDYFSNYAPLLMCQKRMLQEFLEHPPQSPAAYFHLSFMYTALNKQFYNVNEDQQMMI